MTTARFLQRIVADRPLWLDATKTKLLEDGNPDAAFLFVAARGVISEEDVTRFGLTIVDGRVQQVTT